jgi:AraC-like DNA-binding protein
MISLDRLLDGLEVQVEPFFHADRCGPRSGSLELAGGATVRVSTASVSIEPARARVRGLPCEGMPRDRAMPVVAGRIRATYKGTTDIFDHLREPLVERLGSNDPIRRSFDELLDEIRGRRPGCRAMAEALLRRCLILLLRRSSEHGRRPACWMAALEDERLGRAVAAMQDRPEQPFTLPRLAEVAGMSRTVFAARFAEAIRQSPIEFLKGLRLARAAQLLARTDLPVKAVAGRVGYASRSSFTRAFVALHGVGPIAFRTASAPPPPRAVSGRRTA